MNHLAAVIALPLVLLLSLCTAPLAHAEGNPGGESKTFDGKAQGEDPMAGSDSVTSWVSSQSPDYLDNMYALNELTNTVMSIPGIFDAGYLTQINQYEDRSVKFIWHGESSLQKVAIDLAAKLGISTSIEQRSHGYAELREIAGRLLDKDTQISGFKIESVELLGFEERVTVFGVLETGDESAALRLQQLGRKLSEMVGLPVTVLEGGDMLASRSTDSSPFWAGGFMQNAYGYCSSGFGLRFGSTTRATTARHCSTGSNYYAADSTSSYGNFVAPSPDYGARSMAGQASGRTFDGSWQSSASQAVKGWSDLALGSGVCSSGANSGTHCGLIVYDMMRCLNDGYGTICGIRADGGSTQTVAVVGDSGGPMVVPWQGGGLGAAGMIQSLPNEGILSSCATMHVAATCARMVTFTSMHSIADVWGATLVTG